MVRSGEVVRACMRVSTTRRARGGYGTKRYADGTVYEGQWKGGRFEGRGTMRYASGAVYEEVQGG